MPFTLEPLNYPYNALEPYIDEATVRIHHDKHQQAYVDNLNKALAPYPQYQSWPLEQLIIGQEYLPEEIRTQVRNNAGGVYNHELYFEGLSPACSTQPHGTLLNAIDISYGSVTEFLNLLVEAALSQFGSGWAYLVTDQGGNLRIVTTPNQDTPLTMGHCPVIAVDVWEHAYYLKYQNKRADYLKNLMNLIDWDIAEQRYNECIQSITPTPY